MISSRILRAVFVSFLASVGTIAFSVPRGPIDGDYTIHIYSTNDVHGCYFDSSYVAGVPTKPSLLAVSAIVNEAREKYAPANVVLLDVGDNLQGDNAAYYYNYVDTESEHLYSRMAKYMKYDAIALGNHDIETGHEVYDRIAGEIGIPYLAGNAVRKDGSLYFGSCAIIRKGASGSAPEPVMINGHLSVMKGGYAGPQVKIAVLGYTNPNIANWLDSSKWEGMDFLSLLPKVQDDVDKVRAEEDPDVVIVMCHSGSGRGLEAAYENQGMALLSSLEGVDFLFCAHDHKSFNGSFRGIEFINSGARCRSVGHGVVSVHIENGVKTITSKSSEIITVDKEKVDTVMRKEFAADYDAVKKFTLGRVGGIEMPLFSRDAYRGMCDYINLISTVCLKATGADICFAAPLNYNSYVAKGGLVYNDMFSIYPFENTLVKLSMTGEQIRNYLEYSYNAWLSSNPGEHILNIQEKEDERTGAARWSFASRPYNLDQASGLVYEVDYTKPYGSRVSIKSLAGGRRFKMKRSYTVAMTSYRAAGGGGLLLYGAGIGKDELKSLTLGNYPEIRNLIYDFIRNTAGEDGWGSGVVSRKMISDPKLIGSWKFVPESSAKELLDKDMNLLFPRRKR